MEEKKIGRDSRPTMQQLNYLFELDKMGGRRGAVMAIADICSVNHGSVSRFFKTCMEQGILREDYTFRDAGREWLNGCRTLIRELTRYLTDIGIPQRELSQNVRDMIEHLDYYTLYAMIKRHREILHPVPKQSRQADHYPGEVLPYGKYEVYFQLFCLQQLQNSISMADRGFIKPALLQKSKRGSYLLLTVREMRAHSRISGRSMNGRLESLKYEQDGVLRQADIRDDRLRIPLAAFRFCRRRGGEMEGFLRVTVTCNVGRVHMPESTAQLVFWF